MNPLLKPPITGILLVTSVLCAGCASMGRPASVQSPPANQAAPATIGTADSKANSSTAAVSNATFTSSGPEVGFNTTLTPALASVPVAAPIQQPTPITPVSFASDIPTVGYYPVSGGFATAATPIEMPADPPSGSVSVTPGETLPKPNTRNANAFDAASNGEAAEVMNQATKAFASAQAGNYAIEPGDSLDIKFRGTPELNELVTVRPDGKISLQIVGDVTAAGLTPEQLRQSLHSLYASELTSPDISVIVRSFSGNSIYIGGEVLSPGRVILSGRVNTLNAVIMAGGFKDTADQRRVIVRRADGSCCEYDLKSVIECKGGQNIQLQPYDVVYVPKSKIAKVNLFVEQYIDKVLPFSRSYGVFVSRNVGVGAMAGP